MASLGNSTVSNWAEPESSRLRMFMDFLNKPKPNSFRTWALSISNCPRCVRCWPGPFLVFNWNFTLNLYCFYIFHQDKNKCLR